MTTKRKTETEARREAFAEVADMLSRLCGEAFDPDRKHRLGLSISSAYVNALVQASVEVGRMAAGEPNAPERLERGKGAILHEMGRRLGVIDGLTKAADEGDRFAEGLLCADAARACVVGLVSWCRDQASKVTE